MLTLNGKTKSFPKKEKKYLFFSTSLCSYLAAGELVDDLDGRFEDAVVAGRHRLEEFGDVAELRYLVQHGGLGYTEGHDGRRNHL